MRIQVETEKPIAQSAYKIPEVIKKKVKKEIENVKEAGIIRHSCSSMGITTSTYVSLNL